MARYWKTRTDVGGWNDHNELGHGESIASLTLAELAARWRRLCIMAVQIDLARVETDM